MPNVIICDQNEHHNASHIAALQASGHEVVTSSQLVETLAADYPGSYQLLVLGLESVQAEDAGIWQLVEKATTKIPVIGLHNRPSEAMCQAAVRARVAAMLPHSVAREVFIYTVEQLLGHDAAELPLSL